MIVFGFVKSEWVASTLNEQKKNALIEIIRTEGIKLSWILHCDGLIVQCCSVFYCVECVIAKFQGYGWWKFNQYKMGKKTVSF